MKNIFLLLLLFTGMVKAQIVNIPDANFKAYLLSANTTTNFYARDQFNNLMVIDANSDSEIQVTEAQAVYSLFLQSNDFIQSIEGIFSFTNLTSVVIQSVSQINSIDLSGLPNLTSAAIENNNNLVSVNLSGLSNLTILNCRFNVLLSTINLSGLGNLETFRGWSNAFTNLDFSDLDSISYIDCNANQLLSLNVIGLSQLNYLDFSNNAPLTSVNLNGLPLLTDAEGSMTGFNVNNSLANITIVDCPLFSEGLFGSPNLINLTCNSSGFTSIEVQSNLLATANFAGCSSLLTIDLSWCFPLNSVDLSGCIALKNFRTFGSLLSTIDFSDCQSLETLSLENNLIAELDLSMAPNLQFFSVQNCQQLKRLFIKNGSNESVNFDFCGALEFVCADESQINSIYAYFININLNNQAVVNSYCSFMPGGNYNTITGNIRLDANNDGCDVGDITPNNIRVNINDGTLSYANFTRLNGNYVFYTQAGNFQITPSIENPTWFNFSPTTATIPFADNNNNTVTQDFCISPNGFHPDVEVVISPVFFARPGFDATYQITYRNKGNQTFSGSVNLIFDDSKTDFVSANPLVDNLAVNSLSWNYSNLLPFESRTIMVTLNVNSPTETPAVNIGDELNFIVSTFPLEADENPQDNTFQYIQTVVGSYDPNDITCLEGDVVAPSEIGNYLHYAINFENTGTFPAENVVVKTEVDAAKFDIGSLQLMNTNLPVDARISGNKVEFIFKNIQLPIGGHGHILLKIKTNNTLVVGDAVANRADIFFDYNFPIDTGLANTVFQTLSNTDFEIDDSVLVAPNPASNEVIVKADNVIKSIQLYDAQGRIITTSLTNTLESKLDVSSYGNGIYFIKIITEKGIKVQKLQKD